MKYSINGTGNIVAERDIYSLGGFIPKGTVGGKIASEAQLSQDGECWLAGGDISARPDIRIKDNAYIGAFVGATGAHTDGVTEFSGNTLIPGKIEVRNLVADTKNNFFAKDSFIGISMGVLCGPEATTTAFPFEQGGYSWTSPKGTLFSSMKGANPNSCRSIYNILLGRDTYLYIPTGLTVRLMWGYFNTANELAYSGEMEELSAGLRKLEHHTYKVCMVNIARTSALTPADLLATGTKILGHINTSATIDMRPESASGSYVMDKSSLLLTSDNFGLATTQLRLLAGGLYNTSMYTGSDRGDYQVYGTFHNVQRLEYIKYLGNSHRNKVSRDKFISAYDCPLLRVDSTIYNDALADKGDLVLRRCIVPKAEFQDDVINGNTYEDLDFSCANEDLGSTMAGYTRFISSHKQGIYRLSGGPSSAGFVSHKGNLADTARLFQAEEYIPLDGNIMEQGGYTATVGTYYEDSKNTSAIRVRTGKPLPTLGATFPTPPAGFKVTLIAYLGEDFKIQPSQVNPTTIKTEYPYFVVVFGKADDSAINVTDFIALNRTLRIIDHTKAPEITGSAYVGAGCTVRGDVQLHGDPYVNRVFDVNMWERGEMAFEKGVYWEDAKADTRLHARFRLKQPIPVSKGDTLTAEAGYTIWCVGLDADKNVIADSGSWVQTDSIKSDRVKYEIILVRKGADALIEDSDIPLANVKYVRAFKKRRYITNEIDRTSPEDILLGLDLWMKNFVSTSAANKGRYFKELIGVSNKYLSPKSPINAGSAWSITTGVPGAYAYLSSSWDAVTKFLGGGTAADAALMAVEIRAQSGDDLALSDAFSARIVIEFTPTPRIIVPYGSATLFISGPKIRMYDNAVLSRNLNQEGEIVLQGDAVMGYDFNSGSCMCSNGHSDAIIKLP